MPQQSFHFHKKVTIKKEVNLAYLLSLPVDYEESENKSYPLVLFLHGRGERGDNLNLVKAHGPAKLAEKKEFPFILISPQCPIEIPRYSTWPVYTDELIALVDDIIERYRVDEKRVYVTGLSMGGYGTWDIAKKYPEKFAAAAPICGGGSTKDIERLKNIPVWAFHGAKDDVVLIEESKEMVEALRAVGGNVKFTIYPNANHDSWTETYNNPEFYTWLLSQKKE
ncbi:prolyl oligopeptidase family serine peptidase [Pseudogracilibacillus auburnensis]|uniref:carboxylesterase family protein n=1 Tax=Pseudogracilibacillus auburnensis TaxID=1494959 RepID=UPI001A964C23|nr:prolyl oligopeptidase family serine peptidase [Pseudogracilibacillus auburnensis]MBO1004015.1 prolyl oligopeptidase family serine peptidase [Pseudogracilibacillus auburnensis]